MKKLGLIIFSASVLSANCMLANAEPAIKKGAYAITPLASYYDFSNKRHLKNGGGLGLGVAYYFNSNWAAEFTALQFETKQKNSPGKSVNGQYLTLNGLYYFRPGMNFRPYLSAGIGASHFSRTSNNNPSTQGNIGIGGGIVYFIEQSIALRAGANDYYNLTGSGNNDIAVQGGISFYFDGHENAEDTTEATSESSEAGTDTFVLPDETQTNDSEITNQTTANISSTVTQKQAFIAAAATKANPQAAKPKTTQPAASTANPTNPPTADSDANLYN